MSGAARTGTGDGPVPAERYDVALLDLDGVVYTGQRAVPHAVEALARARSLGMRLAFVTNNAARTPATVAAHLVRIGVPAEPGDIVTSAQAAARMAAARVPAGARVLVVGGEGLEVALRERGLEPVRSAEDGPAAVVQGYSADVDWRALTEASYAVARGVVWIASNTDLTIPTERGIAPGNGALVGVVRAATGAEPLIAGKPELPLHRETILRTGAENPLVVGDRLDTDIEGACTGGVDSLLVLTGVTGPAELLRARRGSRPTYVAEDLRALCAPLVTSRQESGRWVCGGWRARVTGGRVEVRGDGSRIDGLRALCAAVWSAPGAGPGDSGDTADPAGTAAALERVGW